MNVLEYLVKPKQQKETLCSTVPSGNSSITSLDFVGLLPTYQIYTEERMPSKKKKESDREISNTLLRLLVYKHCGACVESYREYYVGQEGIL